MPQAIPYVAALGTVASTVNALNPPKPPPMPPVLTMDEARSEAQNVLNPLFGEHLQNALKMVDQGNIRRGFFGQLPGAALARSTAADVGTRQQQAIGQLTGQLQGMSADQAAQQMALALQANQQNLAAKQMGMQGMGNMMQNFGQMYEVWPNQMKGLFGYGPQPNPMANAQQVMNQGYSYPGTVNPSTTFQLSPGLSPGTYRLPSMR